MKQLALPLVVLSLIGLSACATEPTPTGPPSILVWVDATREPAAQAYVESVGDSAEVEVEVYDVGELRTKIALFNQTDSGWPDVVFTGNPSDVAELAFPDNGFAAPLKSLVSAEVLDGYGVANKWCEIDGEVYCLQNDLAQTVLWYDKVLLNELGLSIPTTMEEFAEQALTLEGTGYVVGAIGDGDGLFGGYLQPSGCPLSTVGSASEVRIDAEADECTQAAELLQPLVDAGVLDTRSNFDAGFIAEVAQAGKVVMSISPSWWGDFVMKPTENWAIPEGRVAVAAMPTWEGNDNNYSGAWGGGIYLVSSHAAFPQAAADAAVWLATASEYQATAPTFPAYGPANEAWAERISADTYYAEDIYPVLAEAAGKISPSFGAVRYDFSSGGLSSVLAVQISEGTSIKDALAATGTTLAELAKGSGYTVSK